MASAQGSPGGGRSRPRAGSGRDALRHEHVGTDRPDQELARDLGARGITANLINPGPTDTDTNPADGPGADEERGLVALGRFGRTEEIAPMAALLVGESGRFVTGASIAVDGGFAA